MNTSFKKVMLLMSVSAFFAGSAVAGGHTAEQMVNAGFDCFTAGPSSFIHCLKLEHFGNPAVPVKVFTEDGEEFLGTELLLHPDIYNWQPCPQDGQGPQDDQNYWDFNSDVGYFACHHFSTGHH